jgi:hypothetical protein
LSTTYKQSDDEVTITYGSGEVVGYVVSDTVEVEGISNSVGNNAATMRFLSVFNAKDLEDLKSDGVLGFAPIF